MAGSRPSCVPCAHIDCIHLPPLTVSPFRPRPDQTHPVNPPSIAGADPVDAHAVTADLSELPVGCWQQLGKRARRTGSGNRTPPEPLHVPDSASSPTPSLAQTFANTMLLRRRAVIAVRPCAPPRLFRCPSTAPCLRRDQSKFDNPGPALGLDRRTLLRLAQPLAPFE